MIKTIETDSYLTIDDILDKCEMKSGTISEVNIGIYSRGRPYNDSVSGLGIVVDAVSGGECVVVDTYSLYKEIKIGSPKRLIGKPVICYVMKNESGKELGDDVSGRRIYAISFEKKRN